MKTATVLNWVEEGEQVGISKRGKIVALISPPPAAKPVRPKKRPDFARRLKLHDGDRVIATRAMNDILEFNKGDH